MLVHRPDLKISSSTTSVLPWLPPHKHRTTTICQKTDTAITQSHLQSEEQALLPLVLVVYVPEILLKLPTSNFLSISADPPLQ